MTAPTQELASLVPTLRGLTRGVGRARDYLALTRPRVLALVLFTAPPALVMGHGRWPDPATFVAVLLGTALIGAGSSAFNAWLERDMDAQMPRTRGRPLPSGRLAPREALAFAATTSALGLLVLFGVGGWLPALVAVLVLAHYVGVYTLWLKPRSAQNIVIGGAAGAAAPLIADAARDGSIGIWGIVLFGLVFLWTPPHFWAIALYRKDEYAAAGVPMMPAVIGDQATRRRMLAYAMALIPVSLLPWFGGEVGPVYAAIAVGLGGWFAWRIVGSLRLQSNQEDRRTFRASLLYLSGVFAALLGELVVRGGGAG